MSITHICCGEDWTNIERIIMLEKDNSIYPVLSRFDSAVFHVRFFHFFIPFGTKISMKNPLLPDLIMTWGPNVPSLSQRVERRERFMGHSLGFQKLFGLGNMNRLYTWNVYRLHITGRYIHVHVVDVKTWDVFMGYCMCVCFNMVCNIVL